MFVGTDTIADLLAARTFTQGVFSLAIIATTLWPPTPARMVWAGSLITQFLALLLLNSALQQPDAPVMLAFGLCNAIGIALHLEALGRFSGPRPRRWFTVGPVMALPVGGIALWLSDAPVGGWVFALLALQFALLLAGVLVMGRARSRLPARIMLAAGAMVACLVNGFFALALLLPAAFADLPAAFVMGLGSALAFIILNMGWLSAQKDSAEIALERLAHYDGLTGVLNRRGLALASARLAQRGKLANQALVVIDLDHFKSINDSWGHEGGDRILVQFGETLQKMLGQGELAARLGGEEFCLLLDEPDAAAAHWRSEALRQRLEEAVLLPDGRALRFSGGIATILAGETSLEPAMRRADAALYQAKACGRDCSIIAVEPAAPDSVLHAA